MTTACQACSGRAPNAYLCNSCISELRETLLGLPRWINYLTEAALGQTRLGDSARRSRSDEVPLKVNLKASDLADQVRNSLSTWVRDVCEKRGIDTPELATPGAMARWLAMNVSAIASDEGAGLCYAGIARHIKSIEHVINRPIPPRFCGVCTTEVDGKQCGLALYARRDAIEVTCPNPKCRTTHNIERLFARTINAAEYHRFTREVLIGNQRSASPERYTTGIMGELSEFVHYKAFQRWVKGGQLRPAGYIRPDGRRGIARHSKDDIPEYRLADLRKVRRMMAQESGKVRAG